MTVKELIEELKKMPQEAQVEYSDNWENYTVDFVHSMTHNDYNEESWEYEETEFVLIS